MPQAVDLDAAKQSREQYQAHLNDQFAARMTPAILFQEMIRLFPKNVPI